MRNMTFSRYPAKILRHTALIPSLLETLDLWREQENPGVLVGGLARSFYLRPQVCETIEILYPSQKDIPEEVLNFNRTNMFRFRDSFNKNIVEVVGLGVVTPHVLNKIVETAVLYDTELKVVSLEGLIVLNLFKCLSKDDLYAQSDILSLLDTSPDLSLSEDWNLPCCLQESFIKLKHQVRLSGEL